MASYDSLYGDDNARRLQSLQEDGGAYPECLLVDTSGVSLTSTSRSEPMFSALRMDRHLRGKGVASSNVDEPNLCREHVRHFSQLYDSPKQLAVTNA